MLVRHIARDILLKRGTQGHNSLDISEFLEEIIYSEIPDNIDLSAQGVFAWDYNGACYLYVNHEEGEDDPIQMSNESEDLEWSGDGWEDATPIRCLSNRQDIEDWDKKAFTFDQLVDLFENEQLTIDKVNENISNTNTRGAIAPVIHKAIQEAEKRGINTMSDTKTGTLAGNLKHNILSESEKNAQLQVGKFLVEGAAKAGAHFMPKFTLIEKLTMSKAKRETVVLVAVYFGVHFARTKYDHYSLQAISAYINHKLMDSAIGHLDAAIFEKLFAAPVKVTED